MRAATREFMRRILPPRVYHLVLYLRWQWRFRLPRRVASGFIRKTPKVRAFPGGRAGELLNLTREVNLLAPTKMCSVMTWHGSDKGHRHNYTTVYSALLGELRDRPLRIFELGLGTNKPELVSSMGEMGRPGASLRGWRELFPRAIIYGADIDRDILFESDRIKTFYCDQRDPAAIDALWSEPSLQGGMDLLIDDGLHTFEGNLSFLNGSLGQLRPCGIYVVEDILRELIPQWHEYLEAACSKYPEFEFVFVELPNPLNHYDNNLLLIRRCEAHGAEALPDGIQPHPGTGGT